ncbi:GtrA family protein [Paenibacillus sp. XY044]|uniref:GtrA family protein n=1 Tax=Paenibacillus sp. XY044 TaxID=2026089 RepID=UPI000B985639|nr:GtrA family protein [Paenibacillus sp. XY044]OZB90608.1 hypothetical protein CJP46_32810 [Paenibacillus sp. XY044]
MKAPVQFIRFGIVGILNTAVDFVVFLIVQPFLGSVLGQVVSYAAGMLNSYVWNRRWTFQRTTRRDPAEMIRFAAVNIAIAGLTALLLHVLDGRIPLIAAKLAVTVLGVFVNYFMSRKWVFRDQGQNRASTTPE